MRALIARPLLCLMLGFWLPAWPAAAQHGVTDHATTDHATTDHATTGHAASAPNQPYAGFAARAIKALTSDQVADLQAGRGMGLALAAELNGYPGPLHVLEHAAALSLMTAQRQRAEALRQGMGEQARAIGARMLVLETALDALFAEGRAEPGELARLASEIGDLQGRLRAVHLSAHIGMRDALDPAQRARYAQLRGYAAP